MEGNLSTQAIQYNTVLLNSQHLREELLGEKTYSKDLIIDKQIGYDSELNKYTVPVKDKDDIVVSINKYDIKVDDFDWIIDSLSYREVELHLSLDPKNYNQPITMPVVVIGKDLQPYLIPKKLKVLCADAGTKGKKCESCGFLECGPDQGKEFLLNTETDKEILVQFIGASDQQINGYLRKYYAAPTYNTCRNVDMEITERYSVDEARVTEEINQEQVDAEYVIRKCYIFDQKLKANQPYKFWGTAMQNPMNQEGILIVTRTKDANDDISRWRLSEETKEQLSVFRPKSQKNLDDLIRKRDSIYRDFTDNVTSIYKRSNVLSIFDFIYFSPLNFNFLGKYIHKGWAEALVVGDTRTGKTESISKLCYHHRAGEFITSGENTSVAGVLGGIQQTSNGGKWHITWGAMALNDRRAVIFDEADNLAEKGVIGQMSGARSSGVIEILKIQKYKSPARTRLIFISNPIKGRVSKYNYGVDIVKDIFVTNKTDVAIKKWAKKYDIDPDIIKAICMKESDLYTFAIRIEPHLKKTRWYLKTLDIKESNDDLSYCSYGPMQILYGVAKDLGFEGHPLELTNADTCIQFGAKLLKRQIKRYKGNTNDAIAAYNQGNNRFHDLDGDGIKDSNEKYHNQSYVDGVLKHLHTLKNF